MGSKKSKKKTGLYGLKGPKDNPDPHLAKRLAEDAAKDAGVLGLLKSASGSHIASIFGRDTALGTDAEEVPFERLVADLRSSKALHNDDTTLLRVEVV